MSAELDRLRDLAAEINREAGLAERAWSSALEHALRAGELLMNAKAQLPHGEWLPWLQANFKGSVRTAQSYMRLSAHPNTQALAHLGIEGALKEIATPVPQETEDSASDPYLLPMVLAQEEGRLASAAQESKGRSRRWSAATLRRSLWRSSTASRAR
jgi:hypothetical protein